MVTENATVSIFSSVERLKLINSTFEKALNISYALEAKLVLNSK